MAASEIETALLADIATTCWRLRQRCLDPATGQPLESTRRHFRDVEMLLSQLGELAIEIQDHTGSLYDPSLSLRVAAFQPVAGIERDRILETLKPTVYRHHMRIQVGEVIVGIPQKKEV